MDSTDETPFVSGQKYNGKSHICPFVGVSADPQTRIAVPDLRNFCHLARPPESVSLIQQENFCLNTSFVQCEVYTRSGEGPLPEELRGDFAEPRRSRKLVFPWARRRDEDPGFQEELSAAVIVAEANESENSENIEDELRWTSQESDLSSYEFETPEKRNRRWLLLLGIALVILLVSVLGVFYFLPGMGSFASSSKENTEPTTVPTNSNSLATAVAEMAIAANAQKTAQSVIVIDAQAQSTSLAATATIIALTTLEAEQATPIPLSESIIATPELTACQDLSSTDFEIVNGPILNPKPGTFIILGFSPPLVEASWTIKNISPCIWNQIFLWTVSKDQKNNILTPILIKNGEIINSESIPNNFSIMPGEEVDIVLEFRPENAGRVNSDWVLIVNGLSLLNKIHLQLQIDQWIIRVTETAVPLRSTSKPGEGKTTPKPPRDRPTPTPVP